jgi:small-conductance mechanosensitive channel
MKEFLESFHELVLTGIILAVALVIALAAYVAVFALARMAARRTGSVFGHLIVRHGSKPAMIIFPLISIFTAFPFLPLPKEVAAPVRHTVALGLIASAGWVAARFTDALIDFTSSRFEVDVKDNLAARRMRTRFLVLRRVFTVIIGFVAFSVMLMTFPSIRRIGLTMFASAGVAGLVVGLAARPMLTNLIAGLQIAFTQPIRIDDVVIVEGEYGRVEEISTTYVVVRIWDKRRLVLPLSYFIERPFQNWTRATADILGTVYLYADYTVPVEEVRKELLRILTSSGLWDGKAWGLQVTDATERTLRLRALMSAADSSTAWDLRCHVREKLVSFLTDRYPQCLPTARMETRESAFEATPAMEERKRSA